MPRRHRHKSIKVKNAFWGFDGQLRLTVWSEGMHSISGLDSAVVRSRALCEVFPAFRETGENDVLRRTLKGEFISGHACPPNLFNSENHCQLTSDYYPVCNADGEITGGLVTVNAATRHKQQTQTAEEAYRLGESVHSLTELIDAAQDAIVIRDSLGVIESWNQGAVNLYRVTREMAVGAKEHVLLDTRFPEPLLEIEDSLRINGSWEGKLIQTRANGSEILVESRWVVCGYSDSAAVKILEINRDITDSELANSNSRRAEVRFKGFFDEGISGDFLTTSTGKLLFCNPAFLKMLGFVSETQALKLADLSSIFISQEKRKRYLKQLSPSRPKAVREWEVLRNDGQIITVIEKLVGIFDERDRLVQIQGYFLDITLQRHAEDALRRLAVGLTTAQEEERRRIARELHDEAGQYLTTLNLRLQMLERSLASVITRPSNVFLEMENLRSLTQHVQRKLRTLAHTLHPSVLEHLGLTAALENFIQEQQVNTDVTLLLYVPQDFPRIEPIAERAVYRIAQEAVTNALKHSKANNIAVRLIAGNEVAFVSIRDDGCGFDSTGIRQQSGIGLSGMRERADMLRARLGIRSAKGQGTLLTLFVPLSSNMQRDGILDFYLQKEE